ncbi:MAG: CAP domain-containing protein [Marinilabiliaceae bacterium]
MIKKFSLLLLLTFPALGWGQNNENSVDVLFDKDEMLQRVNEARSESRRCGGEKHEATHPLVWNEKLARAAQAHANDMAEHEFFDHTGSDSSTIVMRVERQDYVWGAVGENVAMGPRTVAEVVEGWLKSPGHCSNIMNSDFREIGAAISEKGYYWVQVFGAPR